MILPNSLLKIEVSSRGGRRLRDEENTDVARLVFVPGDGILVG
jgi:hypothetical protein